MVCKPLQTACSFCVRQAVYHKHNHQRVQPLRDVQDHVAPLRQVMVHNNAGDDVPKRVALSKIASITAVLHCVGQVVIWFALTSNCCDSSASAFSSFTAANAAFAFNAGLWFRRGPVLVCSSAHLISWHAAALAIVRQIIHLSQWAVLPGHLSSWPVVFGNRDRWGCCRRTGSGY